MHTCPDCAATNPEGARFCGACGRALPQRCAACGEALAPLQRFCTACGTAAPAGRAATDADLGADAAAVPAAAATATDGERRHATIVFSDLSGYTALNERLDPEEVGPVMDELRAVATRLVEAHGGIVNQFVGDEIMALFGIPQASRDDARRAVRAVLALHGAVRDLGERHQARLGMRLDLHSSVNSGWVLVHACAPHQGRFGLTGDVVNTGARLLKLADTGELVVGDDTWRMVSAHFEAERLPPVQVRGKALPLQPWRIVREVEAAPAAPLVGRDEDMRHAAAEMHAALAGGARWVVIRGEPGIGKSRLLAELGQQARSAGAQCVLAAVPDFGPARGAVAWQALCCSLLDLLPSDPQAQCEDRLAAALPRALHLHARALLQRPMAAPDHAAYAALDAPARERGARDMLTHLLRARSAASGLLLALEDVHWAEAPALALLARAVAACTDSPLLCVVTTRPPSEAFDSARRIYAPELPALTLDLGALAPAQAQRLAEQLAADDPALAARCVARAGGNPLFLEQLVRAAGEALREALPGSIQALVLARLDRLAPVDKAALQAASVLGQRVDRGAWQALVDPPPRAEPLMEAGLLRPGDDGAVQFVHALVRDGAYASLPKTRRRMLHQRAADWFQARDAGLHAEHLALADSPLAGAAYCAAAREQMQRLRFAEALALAEQGLACAAASADHHGLAMLQGETLRELGRNAEALAAFERALSGAADEDERAQVCYEMATVQRLLAQGDAAWQSLDAAQPAAERSGDALRLSRIHYLRGNLCFARGDSAGCAREHTRALALAHDAGDALAQAQALSGLGDAHYAAGRMHSALASFERCVQACERAGALRFAVMNRAMVGWCLLWHGRIAPCEQALEQAGAEAAALAHRNAEAMVAESLGWVRALTGHPDAGPALERAVALARQVGMKRFELISVLGLACVQRRAGDRAAALELARGAWQQCIAVGAQAFAGPLVLIEMAVNTPDAGEAEALVAQAEALLQRGVVAHNHLVGRVELMRLRLAQARYDEVLAHADALEAHARDEPVFWATHHAQAARAMVRATRNPGDAAVRVEIAALEQQARDAVLMDSAAELRAALAR